MIPERLVPGTTEWELYQVEHKQRYEFFAPRCRGLRVLDAACGVGYGSRILARAGAACVVGIDRSEEAVDFARRKFCSPNTTFACGPVERLTDLKARFDLVLSFETIEHVVDPRLFVGQVRSVLNSHGVFVCSTPNKTYVGRGSESNPYHLSEMDFPEFVSVLEPSFEVVERYHQSRSQAYHRYIDLIGALRSSRDAIRFSRVLRLENLVRGLLRRELLAAGPLPASLGRGVPGDYLLEPIEEPKDTHLTFILVGRAAAGDECCEKAVRRRS